MNNDVIITKMQKTNSAIPSTSMSVADHNNIPLNNAEIDPVNNAAYSLIITAPF